MLGFMFRTEDLPPTSRPGSGPHSVVLSFSTQKSTDLSSPPLRVQYANTLLFGDVFVCVCVCAHSLVSILLLFINPINFLLPVFPSTVNVFRAKHTGFQSSITAS